VARCEIIWSENRSGTTTAGAMNRGRPGFLRKGGVLMVTRIDRLAGALETCKTLSAL
jgi:DNA invertase Pin-like site-specific DNA recombinase